MTLRPLAFATILATAGASASAQDVGDVVIGGGLSTFGLNLEGAYQIDPQLRARAAFMGGFGADYEETDEDGTLEGSFDLGGFAVLADYYPMQNGWRVSGGLFLSNTELSATGTVDLGLTTEAATVSADFENDIAPMITTGYDWGFGNGWALTSEVGAVFVGGVNLEFEADDPTAQAEIDDDPDVQEAISDASDVSVVPYVGIGVSFNF